MSSMKNIAEGMKKNTLRSLRKKAMKIPYVVPQVGGVGMIWMSPGSQFMMNPFGRVLQVSMTRCSMEETLRNPSSTPWITMLYKER